ncbi:cytochrome P450 [Serratia sp. NPDC078593]|uniref:cytochrome P450 n=1 Tax=unclassified Serratia (in: enterobacteria) TaxID=2647522 RepID=UPI0037D56C5E
MRKKILQDHHVNAFVWFECAKGKLYEKLASPHGISSINSRSFIIIYQVVYFVWFLIGIMALITTLFVISTKTINVPILVLTSLLTFAFFMAVYFRFRQLRKYKHIPGPAYNFALGNLKQILLNGHTSRDKAIAAMHEKFGPVIRLHLAWGSPTIVSMNQVFHKIHDNKLDAIRSADKSVLGENLMGISLNETHREHRRVLTPFLGGTAIERGIPLLRPVLSKLIDKWQMGTTEHGSLQRDVLSWSIHSLGTFLCGTVWNQAMNFDRYHDAIEGIEEAISFRAFHPKFVRWIFPRFTVRAKVDHQYLVQFSKDLIQERINNGLSEGKPSNVLDALAMLASGKYIDEKGKSLSWSIHTCANELVSLLLGGTDAMSFVVTQALLNLAKYPDVQNDAYSMIISPNKNKLHGCSVEEAIVRETLRFTPPLPYSSKFSRHQSYDCLGYTIPKKTILMPLRPAISRNEKLYSRPDDFILERLASKSGGSCPFSKESLRSLLPFGIGPRGCVGSALATAMCSDFIKQVLGTFQIVLNDNVEVQYTSTIAVSVSVLPIKLEPRIK